MFETLRFLKLAFFSYRRARKQGHHYCALVDSSTGVPTIAIFVGVGRDAWRISQRACQEYKIEVHL